MRNKLVVFIHLEGHDGAGKTSVANYLKDKFNWNTGRHTTEHIKFPTVYPRPDEHVQAHYYLDQMINKIERIYCEMDETACAAKLVVCDRSFMSTAVYQGLSSSNIMEPIIEEGLDIFDFDLLWDVPDLNLEVVNLHFVMKTRHPSTAAKRLTSRDSSDDVIDLMNERKKIKKIERLQADYDTATEILLNSQRNSNTFVVQVIVDEGTPEQEVAEQVRSTATQVLHNYGSAL